MLNKIIRISISIIGVIFGFTTYLSLSKDFPEILFGFKEHSILVSSIVAIVNGIILYLITPWIYKKIKFIGKLLDKEISKYPQTDILLSAVGLIVGFIIAYLISGLTNQIPIVGSMISFLIYILMGYLGIKVALKSKDDLFNISKLTKITTNIKEKNNKKEIKSNSSKILDTSVIIDGRIADILKTGFLEGKIIVPKFVLDELQHIADSSDDLKRVRGRRGLDILSTIQKELDIEVEISDEKFEDIPEVDSKLLELAKKIDGKVVTNDYNLNKVAQVRGVEVLNINELSNAVKPVAIPGEEMIVQVVKDGKEPTQGVAYLDDGTMIVVENGRKFMNETITVLVTSVLQTPAGRMIFAKSK